MVLQLITSFIASAAFALLFNSPANTLLKCGFVGMVGWLCYILLVGKGLDEVVASVFAAFVIAVVSQFFAKRFKTPVIIFNVGGIIPLVPGGLAYDAMRHFVVNDYSTALQFAAKAFLISVAIAVGIVLSEVINQIVKKAKSVKPMKSVK